MDQKHTDPTELAPDQEHWGCLMGWRSTYLHHCWVTFCTVNLQQAERSGEDWDPCFWASKIRIRKSDVLIRILPFSHEGVERTEIMLAK
jgi:hypothetical protein